MGAHKKITTTHGPRKRTIFPRAIHDLIVVHMMKTELILNHPLLFYNVV